MNKLLIGTAAAALGLGLAAPAQAAGKDGLKLSLGGGIGWYGSWVDQDEQINNDLSTDGTAEDVRAFDLNRDTEIHFSAETTLDNGLTVGFHSEALVDGASGAVGDSFNVEESYTYFSGAWGRLNVGAEDGAAFLLQVAAPSADDNLDSLRQNVQPVNLGATALGVIASAANFVLATSGASSLNFINTVFDYDNAPDHSGNKLTYMTPVFNGFQVAASYTPDQGSGANDFAPGNHFGDEVDDYGSIWEAAARYEGNLGDVGVTVGGGYSHTALEDENLVDGMVGQLDDVTIWDAGVNLAWGAFNLGGAYLNNDHGFDLDSDETVWVVGLDYTTGAFKLGATYYDNTQELDGAVGAANSGDLDVTRWVGGVTYTYGPGMSFRGSVGFMDAEVTDAAVLDTDATFVMVGTQINF